MLPLCLALDVAALDLRTQAALLFK